MIKIYTDEYDKVKCILLDERIVYGVPVNTGYFQCTSVTAHSIEDSCRLIRLLVPT